MGHISKHMKIKYIASLIIAAMLILLYADLGFAAGKGWYWFMKPGGAKTQNSTTGTSDKKDADSTTDTIKDEDKTAVNKDIGTVPQLQTEKEEDTKHFAK